MDKAKMYIKKLELLPHPEGGYYRETYASGIQTNFEGFSASRRVSTAIYYLLQQNDFSAFHRIKSDEMWHFYDGDPLEVFILEEEGALSMLRVGLHLSNDEQPQALVSAGKWFASRVAKGGKFSLVGCTVAPGFDYQDFEMADRERLVSQYPQHRKIIEELTRG